MSKTLYKYNKIYSKVTPNGLGESRCNEFGHCFLFIVAQVNVLWAVSHSAFTLWPGVL